MEILQTKRNENGIKSKRYSKNYIQRKKVQKNQQDGKKSQYFFSHNIIKWIINATIENVNGELFLLCAAYMHECVWLFSFLFYNIRFAMNIYKFYMEKSVNDVCVCVLQWDFNIDACILHTDQSVCDEYERFIFIACMFARTYIVYT